MPDLETIPKMTEDQARELVRHVAHKVFEHPSGCVFIQNEPDDYLNPDAGESAVLSFEVEFEGWKIIVGLLKVEG